MKITMEIERGERIARTKETPEEIAEEDRWVRHDVHCAAHGSHEYDYTGNLKKK